MFLIYNPLILISITPLVGIFTLLFCVSHTSKNLLKMVAFLTSSLTFLLSLIVWMTFMNSTSFFQFSTTFFLVPYWNLTYSLGMDGMSLFFLVLTTFLINLCILMSWESIKLFLKEYLICFMFLEFCLIQVFCVLDMFLFYMFFESVLMPMFLIMGVWGSRLSKMSAAYQFFLYTLIGSFFTLVSMIYMYSHTGTTDLLILWFTTFENYTQLVLWFTFFLGFSVKIPMIPFHMWLPEAHAEAPTAGSVILAGMLLKLGGYGFISFSLPMFPEACMYFSPLMFLLSLLAIIYGSLTTLSQIDLKKMIAYSSMSHMGFVTLGIFSLNSVSIEGSILLMLSHGLISSSMFFCVGVLYDSFGTSVLKYYNGLVQVMPLFSVFFVFFSFANISFPGTSSFMGELMILLGLIKVSLFLTLISLSGVILSASYAIWLVNSVIFSTLKTQYFFLFQDLSSSEFLILLNFALSVLWVGIYPSAFLFDINFSVLGLIKHMSIS